MTDSRLLSSSGTLIRRFLAERQLTGLDASSRVAPGANAMMLLRPPGDRTVKEAITDAGGTHHHTRGQRCSESSGAHTVSIACSRNRRVVPPSTASGKYAESPAEPRRRCLAPRRSCGTVGGYDAGSTAIQCRPPAIEYWHTVAGSHL